MSFSHLRYFFYLSFKFNLFCYFVEFTISWLSTFQENYESTFGDHLAIPSTNPTTFPHNSTSSSNPFSPSIPPPPTNPTPTSTCPAPEGVLDPSSSSSSSSSRSFFERVTTAGQVSLFHLSFLCFCFVCLLNILSWFHGSIMFFFRALEIPPFTSPQMGQILREGGL